jgi:hypothetical protein
MDTALLIADLNRAYSWDLAPAEPERRLTEASSAAGASPEDALETQLAEKINTLIQRDFGALVQLLYRIDVPEQKLRRMLETNDGQDAGRLIARLIMERQWQKIETRQRYRRDPDAGENADTGAERW